MTQKEIAAIDYVRSSLLSYRERPEGRGVGMTVHFMCPACGGASIAVPAVCGQEAEARVYPVIAGPMEADRPKHSRAGSLYEPKPTSCATALELATRPEFV